MALAVLLPVRPGLAWGPEAHRTIALIGDRILQQSDAAVRGKIEALLKTDKDSRLTKNDIASEATWADVLRDRSEEARIATSKVPYLQHYLSWPEHGVRALLATSELSAEETLRVAGSMAPVPPELLPPARAPIVASASLSGGKQDANRNRDGQ